MAFTVTATEGGSTANGIAIVLKVLTGAAVSQPGAINSIASTTPSLSITPANNNSWIYGSILGLTGTYTANGSTTSFQNIGGAGLQFIQCRSTNMTTAGTPQTIGYTVSGGNSISMCLCEINATGVLAEDASSPPAAGFATSNTITTASFTPPAGSLLVLMAATNGGGGTTSVIISDTSGLGLNWVQQVSQANAGSGYSGIWTAQVPGFSGAFFPFFNK